MLNLLDKLGRFLATIFVVLLAISAIRLVGVDKSELNAALSEALFYFGFTAASVGLADFSKINDSGARSLGGFAILVGFVALFAAFYFTLLGEFTIATGLAAAFLGCFGMARNLWESTLH